MPIASKLIVNADDFGLSPGVNAGILEANREGIVTSASLMVRGSAAKAAAAAARDQPGRMSIGLHIDVGEWTFKGGEWIPIYQRAPVDNAKLLADEVSAQLTMFFELVGKGPTHIDSHQHAHRNEPLRSIALEKAAELGIPLRHENPAIRYVGDFYGQDEKGAPYPERIQVAFLSKLIGSLGPLTTELCCHPAALVDFDSTYGPERIQESQSLCDPAARRAIESAGVELISFEEFTRLVA